MPKRRDEQDRAAERAFAEAVLRAEAARESTTLVFKDKHREEVQNYAVVGNSLWILDETKASKVPLDDLDLDTTKRVNEDRGIDFDVRK